MANNIEQMLNDIAEYQKEHGEDVYCLLTKAEIFLSIGALDECGNCLDKALKLAPEDDRVLYKVGMYFEKIGEHDIACAYFGNAAKNSPLERKAELDENFSNISYNFRRIFETAMTADKGTFILLGNCCLDEDECRMPRIAAGLEFLKNKVIYICPSEEFAAEQGSHAETLASQVLSSAESKDGVLVIRPVRDTGSGIDTYDIITNKLAEAYKNAVFIVADPDTYTAVKQIKGKNKIIFDYNHENRNKDINWLLRWADAITCDSTPVYTSVAVTNRNVYLSRDMADVSDPLDEADCSDTPLVRMSSVGLACQMMRIGTDITVPSEKVRNVFRSACQVLEPVYEGNHLLSAVYSTFLFYEDIDKCLKLMEKHGDILSYYKSLPVFIDKNGKRHPANNIHLTTSDKCTGCSSCAYSCPKAAISMKPDEMGFSYPEINADTCVNCGICTEHCPVLTPAPVSCGKNECYAAMAPTDIRQKSSSGGMFSLLASRTLKKGGCVCGAIYDEQFNVRHIITDKVAEIEKMRGSKYVQSDISDMFPKIKAILDSGRHVMFTGCSCQVAGLCSYLGENPENLLTMSFVCAGVPSPAVYRKHLEAITPEGTEITNLSFRDKKKFGWDTGISAEFDNDTGYFRYANADPYMKAFLSGAIVRNSCHNCSFKDDLYSDIEVGDFWGIANTINFDDGSGTSYVSLNSRKGEEAMQDCFLNLIKMARLPKRNAIFGNPRIKTSLPRPKYKDLFLQNYTETNNLSVTFDKTFVKQHFDAVLVLWWSANYGNALTNYALYTILEAMKLKILAVDNLTISPSGNFTEFAERHYTLSSDYFPQGSYNYIADCSNNFIVGSDQVWNKDFSVMLGHSGYFQLKFLPDGKNMISYGSSFGQAANAVDQRYYVYYKNLYDRFSHVSLREKNGVMAMQNVFAIKAEYVLDPVFLLTKKEYGELAENAATPENFPYILTYIINPSPQKMDYLRKLSDKLGMEIINILDAEPVRTEQNMSAFDIGIKKPTLSPEEFVAYFRDADYVVTDSYHGTCFSVIFEKKFTAFVNRQSDRFETFREFEEIKDRILYEIPEEIPSEVLSEINYTPVNFRLEKMRESSMAYLRNALKL